MSSYAMTKPSQRAKAKEALQYMDEWLKRNSLKERFIQLMAEALLLHEIWSELSPVSEVNETLQSQIAEKLSYAKLSLDAYREF